jgi:EpsI family protein
MINPSLAAYVALLSLLAGTVLGSRQTELREPDRLEFALDSISSIIAGWKLVETAKLNQSQMNAIRPTSYIARTYERDGQQMGVFVSYYAIQRAGESMHSPRNCLPGEGWEIWQHGSAEIPQSGRSVTIKHVSIQNAGHRMKVLYWYQSRNRVLANEYLGKVLLVRDALLDGRTGGALVRIVSSDGSDAPIPFAAALMQEVQRCLGR